MYGTCNIFGGTIKMPRTSKEETSLRRRRHTTLYGSSVVGRGLADHDQQRCYHHAPTVKPEAANAVVSS